MATPFEQFITNEMPKRPALEKPSTVGGYDGDPNDPAAPPALDGAPIGTYYLQYTPEVLWRKSTTGSWILAGGGGGGDWIVVADETERDSIATELRVVGMAVRTLNNGMVWVLAEDLATWHLDGTIREVLSTQEEFTVRVSLTGADPDYPITVTTQAQADAWGDFRSIRGALAALPSIIDHVVTVLLPIGIWDTATLDDGRSDDFRELFRFQQNASGATGYISIAGVDSWVQVGGTPTMNVQSSTGGDVTLQALHGLPADTYKTYYLLVTVGTGAGQYKPISSYAGALISCAGTFSPALDTTSVVQIVDRPSTLRTVGTYAGLVLRGAFGLASNFNIRFSRLTITSSIPNATIRQFQMAVVFELGTRVVGVALQVYSTAQVIFYDSSFDERTRTGNWILCQGGFITAQIAASPTLALGPGAGTSPAVWLGATAGEQTRMLWQAGSVLQGWAPSLIEAQGNNAYVYLGSSSGVYPRSDQLAATAVVLKSGAGLIISSASGFAGSTFKGVSSDFTVDEIVRTRWGVLNAVLEKALLGPAGSSVALYTPTGASSTPNYTQEAFTITISATGVDPTFPLRIVNQAQATAWGAFRTIAGAFAACPDSVRHIVTLQLPSGVWTAQASDFYGFERFVPNETGSVYLALQGADAWTQAAGTSSMAVTSSTEAQTGAYVTLQADPGLPADTYLGYYLLVVSGTGAGQYKPIRSYSSTQIGIAGTFSPALNATSVVQIVTTASTLTLPSALWCRGNTYGFTNAQDLRLRRLNIGGASTVWQNTSVVYERCRMVGFTTQIQRGSLFAGDSVFDLRGSTSRAVLASGGTFSHYSQNSMPNCFIGNNNATTPALAAFSEGLGQGSIYGMAAKVELVGHHAFIRWAPCYIEANGFQSLVWLGTGTGSKVEPVSDQLATSAIRVRNGARAFVDYAADLANSSFKGATYDYDLDGLVQDTWANLDADPDKVKSTVRLSAIMERVNL